MEVIFAAISAITDSTVLTTIAQGLLFAAKSCLVIGVIVLLIYAIYKLYTRPVYVEQVVYGVAPVHRISL